MERFVLLKKTIVLTLLSFRLRLYLADLAPRPPSGACERAGRVVSLALKSLGFEVLVWYGPCGVSFPPAPR